MTLFEDISSLLRKSHLHEASELAKAKLKSNPSDVDARHLYIDLLILAGDYERADNQCGIAATLEPQAVMGFAHLRNQLRGMAARAAWFEHGAAPDFPEGPTDLDKLALKLGVSHREGDRDATVGALAALEAERGPQAMRWKGHDIADLRDLDDRTPHALEVVMSGGAYLWIDFSRIAALSIDPISRPRDLAFRPAQLTLVDGAVAPVLLPAIYYGTDPQSENLRLGQATDWVEEPTGITTGRGQRCFLAGDDLVSLDEIQQLQGVSPQAQAIALRRAHG
ncbi:type VI secretion system accessory protein TagJ [Rhizobium oryzicola]|uniref:Type VI secretion system accessory protein TagJ n=1 Tax=Rhizobium oryzicola TaxID=1232668 RepID=A0ABT8SYX5_9HYPH|nr:type VI secretion system accessory protein TagJ [Rhizobium oryzicola]MDO1583088.1 type VI secretion system accessory protein TagJ [Rhizobium oryzicola]